ncbi:hypothetical protein LEP1GSC170_0867 [Leptospira interrogans serovar Bataviae str. HAI135]|nr:hypothetical protein LEP1GSC170_0867 [Leptospira interrogans serovar Bataviae str. HAI135]
MTPGIWLAPFLVRKKSEFFQKYPEAVLKDRVRKTYSRTLEPSLGNRSYVLYRRNSSYF